MNQYIGKTLDFISSTNSLQNANSIQKNRGKKKKKNKKYQSSAFKLIIDSRTQVQHCSFLKFWCPRIVKLPCCSSTERSAAQSFDPTYHPTKNSEYSHCGTTFIRKTFDRVYTTNGIFTAYSITQVKIAVTQKTAYREKNKEEK